MCRTMFEHVMMMGCITREKKEKNAQEKNNEIPNDSSNLHVFY